MNVIILYLLYIFLQKVVRIDEPNTWSINGLEVRADGLTDVYVFTHRRLSFKYGFSPKIPRSLKETADQPLPGNIGSSIASLLEHEQYQRVQLNSGILKTITGIYSNILIEIRGNIELLTVEVSLITRETIPIEFNRDANGYYMAKHLFEPGKSFRLLVSVLKKRSPS